MLDLGADALTLLTTLLHRRPDRQLQDIDKVHALLDAHGEERMRAALADIVAEGTIGIRELRARLEDLSAAEEGRALARPPRSGATARGGKA